MLAVTRRTFLAGAAGTVASASVGTAQTPSVDFAVEETAAAITVHFRNVRCTQPLRFEISKVYWSPIAEPENTALQSANQTKLPKFKIIDSAGPATPDGAVRRSATIQIRNAQFAGSKTFSATFEFRVIDQDCQIQLTTENWPTPKKTTRFAPVDFVTFMGEDSPAGPTPLNTILPNPQANQLVGQLFGDRLGCEGPCTLALGRDLAWTLSGQTPTKLGGALLYRGLGTKSDTASIRFNQLRFAPTASDQNRKSIRNIIESPFDKEVVARAFPPPGVVGGNDRDIPAGISGISSASSSRRPIRSFPSPARKP